MTTASHRAHLMDTHRNSQVLGQLKAPLTDRRSQFPLLDQGDVAAIALVTIGLACGKMAPESSQTNSGRPDAAKHPPGPPQAGGGIHSPVQFLIAAEAGAEPQRENRRCGLPGRWRPAGNDSRPVGRPALPGGRASLLERRRAVHRQRGKRIGHCVWMAVVRWMAVVQLDSDGYRWVAPRTMLLFE